MSANRKKRKPKTKRHYIIDGDPIGSPSGGAMEGRVPLEDRKPLSEATLPKLEVGSEPKITPPIDRAKIEEMAKEIDKSEAVDRLKKLFVALSAKPETVLEMLDRLEIPYSENDEYYTIAKVDLEEGEKRNTEQGGMMTRIYGKERSNLVEQENKE